MIYVTRRVKTFNNFRNTINYHLAKAISTLMSPKQAKNTAMRELMQQKPVLIASTFCTHKFQFVVILQNKQKHRFKKQNKLAKTFT